MLAVQASASSEETNLEVGVDCILENNLHLKITPICIHNLEFGIPKFGLDKSFNQFQFSAATDLNSISFDFGESSSKKVSRSIKLFMEKGSVGIVPKIEWEMGKNLRFFVQMSIGMDFNIA